MDKKENSWFNEITLPNRSTLADSVGYLDRLIGGEGSNPKQFMFPPTTKRGVNNNQSKRLNSNSEATHQQQKPTHDKTKHVSASSTVDLDDVKWLEERKKKFPKPGPTAAENHIPTIGPQAIPVEISSSSPDHSKGQIAFTACPDKPQHDRDINHIKNRELLNHKRNSIGSNTRKKTLFEKLMDSN